VSKIFTQEELQKMVTIQYDKLHSRKSSYWMGVEIDENSYYFSIPMIKHNEELKQITAPFWLILDKELEDYIVE